jgi:hypothetical protein
VFLRSTNNNIDDNNNESTPFIHHHSIIKTIYHSNNNNNNPNLSHTMSSTSTSIQLFRRLMKEAKQMQDYNFRMYAMRRIKAGYDKNRSLQG